MDPKVVEIIGEVQKQMVAVGPQVQAATFTAIFWFCLIQLLAPFVALAGYTPVWWKIWKSAGKQYDNARSISDKEGWIAAKVVCTIPLVGFAVWFLVEICSPANWIGLVNQKAFIAYEVLMKIVHHT